MSLLERVQAAGVLEEEPLGGQDRKRREQLRKALVDRLGLSAVARLVTEERPERAREELKVACEAVLNGQDFGITEGEERAGLVQEVLDDILGLGVLQPLMDDPSITEIMVNGTRSLYFERDGQIHGARRVFETADQIMLVIDRILAPLGRRLDESSPIVNARLPNGDRVNAVMAPIAIDGPVMTIRRFSGRIASLQKLVELGSLPAWYARLLSWAVRLRQDVAVAGGTGSGKTTLLNALSLAIPAGERIVTIEDSAELSFDAALHVVRLEARSASIEGRGAITIRDLVTNALRMRPDRIVVGEVRGEEAIDMLQAMNTGHDGSLTTLHAGSAQEAVSRLVLMSRFGMDLPADLIEEQVATAVDLIVMSKRLAKGQRRVTSTSLVERSEGGGVRLTEIVSFDEANNRWQLVQEPPFIGQALATGQLGDEEVARWRSGFGA
ncbi:MAG: CpaF family protein [Atopobiaceae bacterium]|jgi:pilus assembly protein CpaF|uniref:CpaF family protein n=1 Tax=Muricaecibacterium torontonense TaxID=3032871 RepID=A0A4V3RRG7_9ACTN|nr:CpaF family protein [Muricaecibacterium torontonense]MCI8676039.1 CpaF family protein [Atopobiaceae bacterium]TGY63360.1 CpaF family protein [Muricaecibacterium torontonense]